MSETTLLKAIFDGHEARGRAELVRTAQGDLVLQLREYQIAEGAPDARVYLTPSPDADVRADGAVDLGVMTQFSGDIDLSVPSNVDPAGFRTIVVYCKKYSVEFGRGTLEP